MSPRQRLAFALIAVVIAVGAAVALGGGRDEATERADTPPTVEATPSAVPEEPEAEARPERTATPTPTPRPEPEVEVVRFRDGEVVGGTRRLTFAKGETARFAIVSDEAEEIHVHGYDLYKDVPAGGRASFSFEADIEGIFEVELHGRGLEVAQLRVEP